MSDLISSLPDSLLCHILSFLPTKEAVTASVLSKRWLPLWRSVPTLDFDDQHYLKSNSRVYARFLQSVYAVIVTRDLRQPIEKFRLKCSTVNHSFDLFCVGVWVNAAVQRGVQHLDLSVKSICCQLPPNWSSIYTCKTLVVLKLRGPGVRLKPCFSADLPLLKILHLQNLIFSRGRCLAELLSGSPALEDLKACRLLFNDHVANGELETSSPPKLLRAHISLRNYIFLLGAVNNVKFLRIDEICPRLVVRYKEPYIFPMFHNLTHIELEYSSYNSDWSKVVELLKHCPKLQALVISQPNSHLCERKERADWQDPPYVPKCILLHLESCSLNDYRGTKGEFQFARYIMQNGNFLKRMTIRIASDVNQQEKHEMSEKLSSRRSATCELSFN